MRKALYMRLAGGNLKKNRQLYGPYLIACIVTVMMMCIMILLEGDRGLKTIEGGQSVAATLMFGCIVIAVFSLIILVYINSLLIKQRKKSLRFTTYWEWKNAIYQRCFSGKARIRQ